MAGGSPSAWHRPDGSHRAVRACRSKVAASLVGVPGPDDVPFVLAGRQQAGERELVDGG